MFTKVTNEGENESKKSDYLLNIICNKENEMNKIRNDMEKYLNDKPCSIDNDKKMFHLTKFYKNFENHKILNCQQWMK